VILLDIYRTVKQQEPSHWALRIIREQDYQSARLHIHLHTSPLISKVHTVVVAKQVGDRQARFKSRKALSRTRFERIGPDAQKFRHSPLLAIRR